VAAAAASVDVAGWVEEFACGFARIAGRFKRREPRLQARSFLLGVLSDVDTRSCWQLAEQSGDASPRAMQRLLGEAVWDADAVRDDVRGYVIDAIGDPDGVLILDDTGDLKAGVTPSECNASTPARQGGSRTRRSRCFSPTRPPRGGR